VPYIELVRPQIFERTRRPDAGIAVNEVPERWMCLTHEHAE